MHFLCSFFYFLIFLSSYSSITLHAHSYPQEFTTNPVAYITKNLVPLLNLDIPCTPESKKNFISLLQRETYTLGLPLRLNNKIFHYFKDLCSKPKKPNQSKEDLYGELEYQLHSLVDIIDLAQMLEISIDDSALSDKSLTDKIHDYNLKYFTSGLDLNHFKEITENTFSLHSKYLKRFQKSGDFSFPVPEMETVFLYLKVCFELYESMFQDINFKNFLSSRELSYNPVGGPDPKSPNYSLNRNLSFDVYEHSNLESLIQTVLKSSRDILSVPESSITYKDILTLDFLWRILLDSSLADISRWNPDGDYHSPNEKLFNNKQAPVFFIPYIGELKHLDFLFTLGVPRVHRFDIAPSILFYMKNPGPFGGTSTLRKRHDNIHSGKISEIFTSSLFKKYYKTESLESIKYAFLQFLDFCNDHFTQDENKIIFDNLVNLHHESYALLLPISLGFLETLIEPPSLMGFTQIQLGSLRQEQLIKKWNQIRKSLPLKVRFRDNLFYTLKTIIKDNFLIN